MSNLNLSTIAVLPGDGIGPEVIEQATLVLQTIEKKFCHNFSLEYGLIGSIAIDKTGNPFPQETFDLCQKADAILLGAIGDPKYDNDPSASVRPEQGLLAMRKSLGLYANIRPVKIYENLIHLSPLKKEKLKDIDLIIYRELTGGIYFGDKVKGDGFSSDSCVYHDYEIERITHLAFQSAEKRKKKLTLVDKANVLETSRLWRHIVQIISKQYPAVVVEYLFIDNAAMQIILNPAQFDIVLCDNLFGDILSDEASVLVGSLGLLPSSSRGLSASLYEPIHGSYPQATGLDIANPIATILSVEMMLRDFEYIDEADSIQNAVHQFINSGVLSKDLTPQNYIGCKAIGQIIVQNILK